VEKADMVTTPKTKFLLWLTALALIMACVPAVAAPPIPTMNPGVIHTFIAQTANAALTQTAAMLPSATPTPFVTPTRNTATPTPTVTPTRVFLFLTPTVFSLATVTLASSSDNLACQVVRVMPPNGSNFDPRQDFDVVWTVKNIGQRKWDRGEVDYVYSSGDKFHIVSGYDLAKNVPVGGTIDLVAEMQAPKGIGSYHTTWILRKGSKTFCPMTLTIAVTE
jgi:hypothetical protein